MNDELIWLSYDLGVRGDYENLYVWLDSHKAKECGDSLAVLRYKYSSNLVGEIRSDLESRVTITKRTRIYIIYRDNESNNVKGKFLFGGRKAPPWTGYSGEVETPADDEF